MSSAGKLALLATMAVAATLFAAPLAFAQSETEPLALPAATDLSVTAEPNGTPCTAVSPATPPASGPFATSGGCVVHAGGTNIVLSGHLFGIESVDFSCGWEFDLRLNSAGTGYMTHQELTQGQVGVCNRRPCHYPLAPGTEEPPVSGQGEARPWRAFARENATAPRETLTFLFCFEQRHSATEGMSKRHCNVTIPFTETSNHRYTFTANDAVGSGNPRCEVNGTFTTEATQVNPSGEGQLRTQLEVNHL
jgi:hypothetical protein